MKSIYIHIIAFSLLCPNLFAQNQQPTDLMEEEQWLNEAFKKLYQSTESENLDSINNQIISRFESVLKTEKSFTYPWTHINVIGKVESEDHRIKIFTWHLNKKQDEYEYYGILQVYTKKEKDEPVRTFLLQDKSANLKNPETLDLQPDLWYGALYYGIKSFHFKRKIFYVLYGYDFNDTFSDKKLIEVLTIHKKDYPSFSGTFQMEFQKLKRVIFEYSGQVVMTLRYDDRLNMIVFDHLSPIQPMFTNNYRFYSPDGSYDGFQFRKGVFFLQTDVDARNE